ncbi:MAG: glutamate racemase [Limnobacter sp.]|nr:glutamate racemase [Limnobacter sp.]
MLKNVGNSSDGLSADQLPIAVTDSGAGGLSVLKELLEVLPNESFVYLADEGMMPYGDKPVDEICQRTLQIARYFKGLHAKALVIACNTATAAGADEVRNQYPHWPVVGIEPAVKPAAMMTQSGKVGILATSNTLASDRFRRLVSRFETVAEVRSQPCPGLVELIENHPMDEQAIKLLMAPRIADLLQAGADVLVLGCTHYPFVSKWIQELAGPAVQVIDTGLPVAKQVKARLEEAQLLNGPPSPSHSTPQADAGRVRFLTTGSVPRLKSQLRYLLGPQWAASTVSSAVLI